MDYYEQNNGYGSRINYDEEEPLTTGQWMITLLVLAIPCVNLIMLFVWGFGEGNRSRQNFCRAYLIWYLIIMIGSMLLISALKNSFAGMSL